MPFAAALSTAATTPEAIAEACAHAALGHVPDLAMVFFSPHHLREANWIARHLAGDWPPRALLGCVGEAVIGNGGEVEAGPALSLWLAKWPRPVNVTTFSLALERTADGPGLFGWPDALSEADGGEPFGTHR